MTTEETNAPEEEDGQTAGEEASPKASAEAQEEEGVQRSNEDEASSSTAPSSLADRVAGLIPDAVIEVPEVAALVEAVAPETEETGEEEEGFFGKLIPDVIEDAVEAVVETIVDHAVQGVVDKVIRRGDPGSRRQRVLADHAARRRG